MLEGGSFFEGRYYHYQVWKSQFLKHASQKRSARIIIMLSPAPPPPCNCSALQLERFDFIHNNYDHLLLFLTSALTLFRHSSLMVTDEDVE